MKLLKFLSAKKLFFFRNKYFIDRYLRLNSISFNLCIYSLIKVRILHSFRSEWVKFRCYSPEQMNVNWIVAWALFVLTMPKIGYFSIWWTHFSNEAICMSHWAIFGFIYLFKRNLACKEEMNNTIRHNARAKNYERNGSGAVEWHTKSWLSMTPDWNYNNSNNNRKHKKTKQNRRRRNVTIRNLCDTAVKEPYTSFHSTPILECLESNIRCQKAIAAYTV